MKRGFSGSILDLVEEEVKERICLVAIRHVRHSDSEEVVAASNTREDMLE